MEAAPSKLSMSDALEKAFPCGGCAKYLGLEQHMKICAVNYRKRALDFARLIGAL